MSEYEELVAGLEAVQRDLVGLQQRLHLSRHGVEDCARQSPLRDQRRHPTERGLLLGESLHIGARLGVGDGRRYELSELHERALGRRRQPVDLLVADKDRAPRTALHDDRRPDRRLQPEPLRRRQVDHPLSRPTRIEAHR